MVFRCRCRHPCHPLRVVTVGAAPAEESCTNRGSSSLRFSMSVFIKRQGTGHTRGMAQWDHLTDWLATADETARLSWAELDQLVGGMPPSAARHRAWWSGDRTHVRAWRRVGYHLGEVDMGREVTFVRSVSPSGAAGSSDDTGSGLGQSRAADAVVATDPVPTTAQLLLVSCVKSKKEVAAPAKDLYTSPLFAKQRRYAEKLAVPWFILSAEHGLVAPDEQLAPYERYLPNTSNTCREAWGTSVVERLELLAGPLDGRAIEIHAGRAYAVAITGPLARRGATLLTPLAGLSLGLRLQWYGHQAPHQPGPEVDRDTGT